MKRWLNSIMWNIHWWMLVKSPLYINCNIFKCYDVWRPWRKYFKKPSWRYWGHWKSGFNILRIECEELMWKYKYVEPRHEEDPSITLSFLYWTWRWTLGTSSNVDSLIYWETILWMNRLDKKYNNKAQSLYTAISYNTWTKSDGEKENACAELTPLGKQLYQTWSHHLDSEARSTGSN